MSEPVVVVLNAENCVHCVKLMSHWETSSEHGDCIVDTLKKVRPGIRTVVVNGTSISNWSFDTSVYPKSLKKCAQWFPMVMLVSGELWDFVLKNPDSDIDVTVGSQVLNGRWENGSLRYDPHFDISRTVDWEVWLHSALKRLSTPRLDSVLPPVSDRSPENVVVSSRISYTDVPGCTSLIYSWLFGR